AGERKAPSLMVPPRASDRRARAQRDHPPTGCTATRSHSPSSAASVSFGVGSSARQARWTRARLARNRSRWKGRIRAPMSGGEGTGGAGKRRLGGGESGVADDMRSRSPLGRGRDPERARPAVLVSGYCSTGIGWKSLPPAPIMTEHGPERFPALVDRQTAGT